MKPGQQRKIKIIENTFGLDWQDRYTGMAIDAVYNLAIKDERKSIFCKIDKNSKEKLIEMTARYDVSIGELFQDMIDFYHTRYKHQQKEIMNGMAQSYSGKILP